MGSAQTICAAKYHAFAQTDMMVYGWGYNTFGQLGDGTTTNRNMPVPIYFGNEDVRGSLGGGYYYSLMYLSLIHI